MPLNTVCFIYFIHTSKAAELDKVSLYTFKLFLVRRA